jgi:hypothetical protein
MTQYMQTNRTGARDTEYGSVAARITNDFALEDLRDHTVKLLHNAL